MNVETILRNKGNRVTTIRSDATIADGNETALQTIAGNRADMPRYEPLGRIYSPAVRLRGWKRRKADVEVRRGTPHEFVLQQLSRKQFAPAQLLVDDFYTAYDSVTIR